MSIQFGDILQHNNLLYPIVDINDVKGGLRSIATFSSPALVSEYASIPEKYRSGYSLLLETSTGTIYYLAGVDPTNVSHWSPVGIGGNGYGVTNTIPKWTSSSILGNSNISDNGDTITISGNLMVIGTTSTISTENLLVKDPIILLAGSQSGVPTYDAGLFVNRGSSDTQAFIWDESEAEFKFITTTSGATVSGDVIIGTYSTVRTGILRIGTQSIDSNDRFVVSSSGGTISLVVDENGYVYNRGRGNISTNTAFGLMTLGSNTSGDRNTAFGASALSVNTTGSYNTALGFQALYGNTTGTFNVGLGYSVLSSNTTGAENIGIGYSSLGSNTTGSYNVSIGKMAMLYNTTGSNNTAVGWQALPRNTTGYSNMGIGRNSMFYSKTGVENTAVGDAALYYNTLGSSNTALGSAAGFSNTTGVATIGTFSGGNGYTPGTYSGVQLKYYSGTSLDGVLVDYPTATIVIGTGGTVSSVTLENTGKTFQNTSTIMTSTASVIGPGTGFTIQINSIQTAQYNTTIGNNSLYFNTIGSNNTSLGYQAGSYTSVGNNDISDNSIFIGFQSRAQYSNQTNQIVIGYDAYGNGSNTVTLGNDSIIKTYLKGNVQLPTIPTTSTGTYSILTRNDITGEVEKIVVAGTVTDFVFTNANGITGAVTNSTTTPTLVLSLGAITPTTVVASSTITGSNLTGTNTGDQDLSGLLVKANNFSDVTNTTTARTNLGLGTLATQSGTFSAKQDNITLTTTGSSGAATFASNTLNVPNYTLSGLGGQAQLSGTGFIKASGTTISYDNSTYLTTSIAASTYAPISTTPIILLNDNTTTSAVTGTTSNTILNSYLVPSNTFASGDRLIVNFLALKSTAVGPATYRLYINTTNSLIGATQIATFANAIGSKFQLMERNLSFKSSTSLEVLSSTVGNAYDLGTDTNLPSTITYDTTQAYYLIISVIPLNSADSFNQSRITVTKYKSKTTF